MDYEAKIVETLAEIINVPSVTGNEDALCSLLEGRFLDKSTRRVGNSLVVGDPDRARPFYALYGHLDTVPEQGEPKARIENGNLVGLGASDMKSGVAVMIDLLEDESLDPIHDLVFVFYAAEEGAHDLNELRMVLDACPWLTDAALSIVLEPTDLNVEIGCQGVINADVIFHGKSSHSARPWLGENAVTKGGAWLSKLHAMEPELVEIGGLEYREVFSVTRAEGGIANNIIPPTFMINLNHRFPPIYSIEQAEERIRAVAADADEVVLKDRAPAGGAAPDDPHVRRLERVAGGRRQAKQGWTDVARLTERGAVAVNYGPGLVAQAHQVGEYVPIANLVTAYEVMRRFLSGEGIGGD
ncbi:MAG: succinyl-diaminopimelate desuccinylase [Acidimicrobiia bacterium]|nr:succinyl-diaminopimelate desuccinylase [Acidimicrobiia bacterium]